MGISGVLKSVGHLYVQLYRSAEVQWKGMLHTTHAAKRLKQSLKLLQANVACGVWHTIRSLLLGCSSANGWAALSRFGR